MLSWLKKIPAWYYATAVVAVIVIGVSMEITAGRTLICKCGDIKLWEAGVNTSGNSQHISDWYIFSHIIHGFIFYGILWLFTRRLPQGLRIVIATLVEVAWEVFENSSFIINRYRAATISLDYFGDSVLNSVFDMLFMLVGYVMAMKMPVWMTVVLAVAMELFVGYYIRDNLTLNIIMLVHPVDAIKTWQTGA